MKYSFIAILLVLSNLLFAQRQEIDSLKAVVHYSGSESIEKPMALLQLGENMYMLNQPDSARYCWELAGKYLTKQLNQNPNDKKRIYYKGQVTNFLGFAAANRGDNQKALEYFEKSVEHFSKTDSIQNQLNVMNNIAQVARRTGNYVKAIDTYYQTLKIAEKKQDKYLIGNILNNLSLIYKDIDDHQKALNFQKKAITVRSSLALKKDKKHLQDYARSLNNLGIIYKELNEPDSALKYYNQALKIRLEVKEIEGIAVSLNSIGTIYSDKGELMLAKHYFHKSFKYWDQSSVRYEIVHSIANLASVYSKLEKPDSAIFFAKKALTKAHEFDNLSALHVASRSMFRAQYANKHYEEALKYHLLSEQYEDSLSAESDKKELIKKDIEYQFEKEKADLEKNKLIAEQQNEKQKLISRFAIGGFVLVIVFLLFLFNRFRITQKQKKIISQQKAIVEEKNEEIVDSITYAKRIQTAILPHQTTIKQLLPNSFVYYQPKDIVSGDFYWIRKIIKNNSEHIAIAAVDCTGHGVPGALMSIVGSNGLNKAVDEYGATQPNEILELLNKSVVQTLQTGGYDVKDGMDMSCCVIPVNDGDEIQFAGAMNPLYLISNGELNEVKADKIPIGADPNSKYTNHNIAANKNDIIYLFSDGFIDQFGGSKNKKYMSKNFKKLLISINEKPMEEQHKILAQTFQDWKGTNEQIDDVCIIGVRT